MRLPSFFSSYWTSVDLENYVVSVKLYIITKEHKINNSDPK